MEFKDYSISTGVQILKRQPFEAIPFTLDFTDVTDVDEAGNKVVKAGTPIGADGAVDNTGTVVGISLYDVTEVNPQAVLLKKAYIDLTKAETSSGLTIDADVNAALPMIIWE